jgi:heptosyltransferase I
MWTRLSTDCLRTVDARRIAVIKPSALGDVVQTLPLLPILRERFPDAEIAWVVNRDLAELVEGHPCLTRVIGFERRGGWSGWWRLLRELRAARFDLVFDLQGLLRTGVMTAATRAPLRVGLETAREGSALACHAVIPDTGRHVAAHRRYWRVAEALGLGERSSATTLPLRPEHRAWAKSVIGQLGEPVLAINPGARWETKRWPVERFAVIAAKAYRAYGFSSIIVGSPGERPLAARLAFLLRKFLPASSLVNLAGETSLLQLAAILEAADVAVTNDSGPMHLAAGLGTHVVGVFTCTSPERSGPPPGDRHALVATQLPCAAGYHKQCPHRGKHHLACFEELDAERVWRAFSQLVERHRRRAA